MTSDFTLMEDESSTLTMEQAGLKPNNRITYTEINNQVTPKGSWRIMSHHEDGLHSDSAQCWHNNLQKAICIYNLPFSLLSSRPRPRPQLPMSPMLTLQACVTHTPKNRYPHQCQCLVLAQKNVGIQLFLAFNAPMCVLTKQTLCLLWLWWSQGGHHCNCELGHSQAVHNSNSNRLMKRPNRLWNAPTSCWAKWHCININIWALPTWRCCVLHVCMHACMHGMRICCWIIGDEGNRTPDLLYAKQTFCHWTTSPENLELCWPRFRS